MKTLFLDHYGLRALEHLALTEGLVTNVVPHLDVEEDATHLLAHAWRAAELEAGRPPEVESLLRLVVIAERVDGLYSLLDLAPLVDAGLIKSDGELVKGNKRNKGAFAELTLEALTPPSLADQVEAKIMSLAYLSVGSKRVAERCLRRATQAATGLPAYRVHDLPSIPNAERIVLEYLSGEAFHFLNAPGPMAPLEAIIGFNATNPRKDPDDAHPLILSAIRSELSDLERLLILSDAEAGAVIGCELLGDDVSHHYDPIKLDAQLRYLVRTRPDTAGITLPQPPSLTDALRLRVDPDMTGLRGLLRHWMEALQIGDDVAAVRIYGDVSRAAAAINAAAKWSAFRKSPLCLGLELAGAFIGPLGALITLAERAGDRIAGRWTRQNGWVLPVVGSQQPD